MHEQLSWEFFAENGHFSSSPTTGESSRLTELRLQMRPLWHTTTAFPSALISAGTIWAAAHERHCKAHGLNPSEYLGYPTT
jgi:hypothetical protein